MPTYWQEPLIIRSKSYPRFVGAPLDGYTDSPFRMLVRRFSPDNLLYTTIRHATCVVHERSGALKLDPHDRPLAFQITANKTAHIQEAVEKILAKSPDIIDLNIACPAKNVVKSRAGSALMADTHLLTELITLLRKCTPIALTVKMRAGFKEPNALILAKLLCDLGIDALAIHPRLQTQKFAGPLDWDVVKKIKESVAIPVLYSGGIKTFSDAHLVHEKTGVDGFLIGQAMLGQPWKLAQMAAHAQDRPYDISFEQVIHTAIDHFDAVCSFYGAPGVNIFKKHAGHYVCNIPNCSDVRKKLFVARSEGEVRDILGSLLKNKHE